VKNGQKKHEFLKNTNFKRYKNNFSKNLPLDFFVVSMERLQKTKQRKLWKMKLGTPNNTKIKQNDKQKSN